METLKVLVDQLRNYYDIDKVKSYSVYVWNKDGDENIFDIQKDRLVFYGDKKDSDIPDEARCLIREIQKHLK